MKSLDSYTTEEKVELFDRFYTTALTLYLDMKDGLLGTDEMLDREYEIVVMAFDLLGPNGHDKYEKATEL